MAKNSKFGPMEQFLVHFGRSDFGRSCGAPDPPAGAGPQTPLWGATPDPPPPLVRRTRPPLDGHKFDPKVSEASGAHRVLVWGLKKLMRAYRVRVPKSCAAQRANL